MKQIIMLAVIGIMLVLGGCAGEPQTQDEIIPSIGGIHLGDSATQVTEVLGDDYEETFHEEGGHFGESYYLWDYKEGIELIIGKESGKVMQIDVTTSGMETDMGVKVGDQVTTAIGKYQEKYTEPESIHSGEKLEGWFEVGEGEKALVIFDVDKDNDTIVNSEITSDMKVEMIRLVYSKYID